MVPVRIALAQLRSTEDESANLQHIAALAAEATVRGAQLLALPENATWLRTHSTGPVGRPLAGHPVVTEICALATHHGLEILLGSILLRDDPAALPTNSSLWIGSDGTIRTRYDKIHLFQVDLGPSTRFDEATQVRAGHRPVSLEAIGLHFGLTICYDLRFAELYRALARLGANVLLVPSAFTERTGRDHWEVLLRARAIENQAFVLAPAQWGEHGDGRVSYGRTMAIDPWGTVIATASDGQGLVVVELDAGQVQAVRRRLPSSDHHVLDR